MYYLFHVIEGFALILYFDYDVYLDIFVLALRFGNNGRDSKLFQKSTLCLD